MNNVEKLVQRALLWVLTVLEVLIHIVKVKFSRHIEF
jgi:hypothetical protein